MSLFYSQSNIFIQYDTIVFGSNFVSNNKITATKGQVIDSPYYIISMSDSASNLLKIAVTHSDSASSLPTIGSNQQLCHLKINVSGFNLTAIAAAWDTMAMVGHSLYQRTISGLEFPYDIVRVSGLVGASRSINDSIVFGVLNAVVDSSKTHLDFDIVGNASIYNAPLASYRVTLTYNPLAFDSAGIVNRLGYGDDGMGDSIFDFYTTFSGGVITAFLQYNSYYDIVYNTMNDFIYDTTIIAHVTLRISDCGETPGIAVDRSNSSAYWSDSLTLNSFTPYSPVLAGDGYNNGGFPMCTPRPIVTWITPYCINAGSFEVLTINGRHFGTDTGTVYFNNADVSFAYVHTLKQDIRHWDDTMIQLLIPSEPEGTGVAASGNFYVQTPSGLSNAADSVKLSIGYANFNRRNWGASIASGNAGKATFVYLRDTIYIFQLDSSLFYNNTAKTALAVLFDDMSCRTGISFTFDPSGPSTARYPNEYDHINLISLQPFSSHIFPNHLTLGVTDLINRTTLCYTDSAQYNDWAYYLNEVDISIIDTPYHSTWLYDIAQSPTSSQMDFYTVIEHELAHAALLCHSLPDYGDNVTYPIINRGENIRSYGNDPDDVLGIRHMLTLGRVLGAASTCAHGMPLQYGCNPSAVYCVQRIGGINSIDEIASSSATFNATLYPNPYQDNTVVHIDVSDYEDFIISMYDMVGHLISQRRISSGTSFDVPLSDFEQSSGVYLVQVSDAHSRVVFKLIKL